MALTGLRPARELVNNNHSPQLSGAYDLYVQDVWGQAEANQGYYLAKWLRLPAGTYRIRAVADDNGSIKVNGQEVIALSSAGTIQSSTFPVPVNGVFRFDCYYRNIPAQSPAYIAYEIMRQKGEEWELFEVSRANDFLCDLVEVPTSALPPAPPYDSDIRLSYPVFLPQPNWKDGIMDRIEWQTDVMISETGAEQRRPIRLFPRRSFEASFLRWEENRTILDSTIAGIGSAPLLLPLWHDMTGTENDAPAGSVRIDAQVRVKDFNVGDVVLLRRDLEWDYEANIIAGMDIDAGQITLAYGLQKDTPRGTRLYPVRVAQIREAATGSQLTDAVATTQIRFHCLEKYDLEPSWSNLPVYSRTGLHIFNLPSDWKNGNDVSSSRQLYVFDNQSGVLTTVDPGLQNIGSVKKQYTITGRTNDRQFRQLLFALKGRTMTFHLPQDTNDFILTRDISGAEGALVVRRCGYTQFVGSTQETKRDIMIELYDGTAIPTTIISSRTVENEEWLFLAQSIPSTPMHMVRRIGYMPVARLDIDGVEIKRLTDSAGTSQVSLTFKLFDDRRKATPVPIP